MLKYFWAGLIGLFATKPYKGVENSTAVFNLARWWSSHRCAAGRACGFCDASQPDSCRIPTPARRFMSYCFGPIGWSGGPPEHASGSEYDFLGVRRDHLGPTRERVARCVVAHEMAHERQRHCQPRISTLSARLVYRLEREADREMFGCARTQGFSCLRSLLLAPPWRAVLATASHRVAIWPSVLLAIFFIALLAITFADFAATHAFLFRTVLIIPASYLLARRFINGILVARRYEVSFSSHAT